MKENKSNAVIAIATVAAAILMALALSLAIGKWSFGSTGYKVTLLFPSATGINVNSEVKYAGATVGRVTQVALIPRDQQTQDPLTKDYNCVKVVVEINDNVQIGEDSSVTLKQDGLGISAKYVLIMPGQNHDSKLLTDGATMQGTQAFDLTDLVQPAGEALHQARNLVVQLQPMMTRFDALSRNLEASLPPLIDNANKFLSHGDAVLANLSTPESKERINDLLANLRVSTDNLKVVSSNAKALTATLAATPWRLVWGGPTVPAPPENEVLKSDKVIRLTPDVDVNGFDPTQTGTSTQSKKKALAQP
jgi:phospholipid/cholesterol/gamma-HCH transport system substrate-binding protein